MFSHLNEQLMPKMVDISSKRPCKRTARAEAEIVLNDDILKKLHMDDIKSPKGSVFHTAILAGIQAVKQTPQIIPLCHPIPISAADIDITLKENTAHIVCRVISQYATGVEMEAITGAAATAITIYDMCKGINSEMIIQKIRLLEKTKESQ